MESGNGGEGTPAGKRRVMVVADPGRESAGALQWALSHALLEHDDLILLHVEPPNSSRRVGTFSNYFRRPAPVAPSASFGSSSSSSSSSMSSSSADRDSDFLEEMRAACEAAQPKVKVQIERVEMDGKDKVSTILSQTKVFGVDLLVIGQRRISSILGSCKLSGSMSRTDTAEYLIEHSKCLCVGVQKKGQNGGYFLNTKTHKNFWLLA